MQLFGIDRPRMLDIQAEYGLKPPQFFALNALDEPAPMSSIANMLRCDRSAVTWITDRLEERGYVERRSDRSHRRRKRLALTDKASRGGAGACAARGGGARGGGPPPPPPPPAGGARPPHARRAADPARPAAEGA